MYLCTEVLWNIFQLGAMARPLASALFATLEPPVDAADPTADPTTSTSPRCAFGAVAGAQSDKKTVVGWATRY